MILEFFYFFIGYLLGRIGHYYINPWMKFRRILPHHWFLGLVLMFLGTIISGFELRKAFFFSGMGIFVSDILDFLKLRFYEPDKPGKMKFWHFD